MIVDVQDLTGGELDLWVAKVEGRKVAPHPSCPGWWMVWNHDRGRWDTIMQEDPDMVDPSVWSPSVKWEHGGPIIDRNRDRIAQYLINTGETITWLRSATLEEWMRAYVASRIGDKLPTGT